MRTVRPALVALAFFVVVAPGSTLAQDHSEDERPPIGDEPQHHQESEDHGPRIELPWRILAAVDASAAVRIVTDPALQQTVLTPGYLTLRGGVIFPGVDGWRHGATIAISSNLAVDGPYGTRCVPHTMTCDPVSRDARVHARDTGLDLFSQYIITPSYVGYVRLSEDFVVTGRFGVPIAVAPYIVLGFELAGSIAWMITAGLGIFVEAQADLYLGIDTYPYPTIGAAAGIQIDYEILPDRPAGDPGSAVPAAAAPAPAVDNGHVDHEVPR